MEMTEILRIAFTTLIGAVAIALVAIFIGLIYKGIDRKLSAHMQGRIGPPLRQPFYDVKKLFTKENIIPKNAIGWVFNLAPLLGLVGAISILLYLPIIPNMEGGLVPLLTSYGDIILILYLLMIPSLAMVIGGFSSGSPYATVGAQREMVTMMAYEFPLAIIIISLVWKIFEHITYLVNKGVITADAVPEAFSLTALGSYPIFSIVGPVGFIGALLLLFVLVIVTPAELSKIPFDSPEAETEIGGGLLVEYSGRNLGMFYLMDAVKTVVMGSIIVALFFPYNLTQLGFLNNMAGTIPGLGIDFAFFLLKVLAVIIISVTIIRVAIARLKIDQIVYTYWLPLTLISLIGLMALMWDKVTMTEQKINLFSIQFTWPALPKIVESPIYAIVIIAVAIILGILFVRKRN